MGKVIIGVIVAIVLFLAFWGCCEFGWLVRDEIRKLRLRRRRKARGGVRKCS